MADTLEPVGVPPRSQGLAVKRLQALEARVRQPQEPLGSCRLPLFVECGAYSRDIVATMGRACEAGLEGPPPLS